MSSKKVMKNNQISKVVKPSKLSNLPKSNLKPKTQVKLNTSQSGRLSTPSPQFNVGGFVDTVGSVIKTGSNIISQPLDPLNYLDVPKTITKVIDTVQDISGDVKKLTLSGELPRTTAAKELMAHIEKEAPVFNTSSIPTAYSSSFSGPEFNVVQSQTMLNGMRGVRVTGTSYIHPIRACPPGTASGTITSNTLTDGYRTADFAIGNFGTRFDTFVQNYDRRKIRKLVYTYVPSCPTSTPGNIHMCCRWAPKDPTTGGLLGVQQASQLEMYATASCYSGVSLVMERGFNLKFNGDFQSTDPKFYSDWFIVIGPSDVSTNDYAFGLGKLYVSFDIDLYGAFTGSAFPPLINDCWITRFLGNSILQKGVLFKNEDIRKFLLLAEAVVKKCHSHCTEQYDKRKLSDKEFLAGKIKVNAPLQRFEKKTKSLRFDYSNTKLLSESNLMEFGRRFNESVVKYIDKMDKLHLDIRDALKSFLGELLSQQNCLIEGFKFHCEIFLSYSELENESYFNLYDPRARINYFQFIVVAIKSVTRRFMVDTYLDFSEEDFPDYLVEFPVDSDESLEEEQVLRVDTSKKDFFEISTELKAELSSVRKVLREHSDNLTEKVSAKKLTLGGNLDLLGNYWSILKKEIIDLETLLMTPSVCHKMDVSIWNNFKQNFLLFDFEYDQFTEVNKLLDLIRNFASVIAK